MKIEIKESLINKNELKIILEIFALIEDLSNRNRFNSLDSIESHVIAKITEEVSRIYLSENRSKILDSINLDRIVKGCELKIIENR